MSKWTSFSYPQRRVIEEGKDELSVAFKMMHQMEYQMEYVVEEAEKCVQCVINTGE